MHHYLHLLAAPRAALARSLKLGRRNSILLASCALCCGAIQPALAVVIYSTDFQNPPFNQGLLAGQDSWNALGTSTAVTIPNPGPGTQKVNVSGNVGTPTGAWRNTLWDTSIHSDKIVVMEGEFLLLSGPTLTSWQFAGLTTNLGSFIGGFNVLTNGTLQLITAGFPVTAPVVSRGTNNLYDVRFDFTPGVQTFSVFLNGGAVAGASNIPFNTPQTAFGAGLFKTFGGGNDGAFLDHYSVTAVPEPATYWLLLIGAIFGSLGIARSEFRSPGWRETAPRTAPPTSRDLGHSQ